MIIGGSCMRGQPTMHAVNLGELDAGVEDRLLHLRTDQVAPGVGADIGQPAPFIHSKLPHANLDVQTVVIVLIHVALGQMVPDHLQVDILAALDFGNQSSSRLGERAQRISEEVLPPLMALAVGSRRALAGSHTDEDANFPPGPLVDRRLIQNLRRRIVRTRSLVDKDMLSDLDGFERKSGGRGCPTSLPDRAIELRRGLLS